jgi:hypothetical protein
LTPAGLKALSAPLADVLSLIGKKWLKSSLLDEFTRIDVTKGQKSKSRVMTALPPRRAVISDMLRRCPIETWISVGDFSRFTQAKAHTFEVTHDPWALYICEWEYGSLGHDGFHGWDNHAAARPRFRTDPSCLHWGVMLPTDGRYPAGQIIRVRMQGRENIKNGIDRMG